MWVQQYEEHVPPCGLTAYIWISHVYHRTCSDHSNWVCFALVDRRSTTFRSFAFRCARSVCRSCALRGALQIVDRKNAAQNSFCQSRWRLRVTATIALSCFGVGYEGLFEEYFPPFPNISDFVMVMWPAGVTLMVAGPAAFVLTHKMDQERLDFVARISCAVMLAMLVLVTFRVFVSPVSLAVSSHIQRYDVALTPRLPLIVFLAGLMIAGASRIRLPAGTRGHAVTALVFCHCAAAHLSDKHQARILSRPSGCLRRLIFW